MRLTHRDKYDRWCSDGSKASLQLGYEDYPSILRGDAVNKLAEYEDTGYSPLDIKSLEGEWNVMRAVVDFYRSLEEQGLLVRLPCKVGDILFWLDKGAATHEIVECRVNEFRIDYYGPFVVLGKVASPEYHWRAAYIELIGKKLFLTREEAEAALKGGQDDGT